MNDGEDACEIDRMKNKGKDAEDMRKREGRMCIYVKDGTRLRADLCFILLMIATHKKHKEKKQRNLAGNRRKSKSNERHQNKHKTQHTTQHISHNYVLFLKQNIIA
jgi:hypothetical protein